MYVFFTCVDEEESILRLDEYGKSLGTSDVDNCNECTMSSSLQSESE